jgi:putative component of membrane protein insertase Oxa1/YidC/SpoIIIJ protein YidD
MKIIIKLINFYQKTVSPDHGVFARPNGFCPFYPSCSEYTKQSIEKYGVLRGTVRGSIRLCKCIPGRKPTLDPV